MVIAIALRKGPNTDVRWKEYIVASRFDWWREEMALPGARDTPSTVITIGFRRTTTHARVVFARIARIV
jgi:hypothetical protein